MSDGYYNAGRAPTPLLERIGTFFFAWRNWVFTGGLIALLVGFRPVPLFDSPVADLWLDVLGFCLALGGQGIRMAVIGYAPIKSGGSRKKVAAEELVTNGLLNHVRNPLYVGNIMVMVGLVAIHGNPWVCVLGVAVTVFGYCAIVAAEEAFLSRQFGAEYAEYCRRVPRWIPRLRGLRQSLASLEFHRRRVILQEYGSVYIAVAMPLALMIYEQLIDADPPQTEVELWVLVGLWVLATTTWMYFRRVKLAEVARRKQQGTVDSWGR
jgi:protein-S-isoprenylcysteine O-methyltransferase Ste14